MAGKPGKINSTAELVEEVQMLVSRLNYDAIPEEFCGVVREAKTKVDRLTMRAQIERRQQNTPQIKGALIVGKEAHPVEIPQIISHGFSVISKVWIKEGEVLKLRLEDDDPVQDYPCAVVNCRQGSRPDDDDDNYYLMLEKLTAPYAVRK